MAPSARAEHPLLQRLQEIRQRSETLIAGLQPDDLCLQGMADASPAKWHLGHTTWFFEQFLLQGLPGYEVADSRWSYLFNSYYEAVGERQPRPQRGLLTRPSIAEVLGWRQRVTAALESRFDALDPALLELGLQHEQQHQELLLMDLLDGFSRNPLEPAAFPELEPELDYDQSWRGTASDTAKWIPLEGGLVEIGRAHV